MRFTPRCHPKQNSKNRRHAKEEIDAKEPRIQGFCAAAVETRLLALLGSWLPRFMISWIFEIVCNRFGNNRADTFFD
jgi:hypothetical protein